MSISLRSAILSLALSVSLSLSQAAPNNPSPTGAPSAVPECAANCMSIKITEAATWFGPGDVQAYCQHPEFLEAYNICLTDHCKGEDLAAGKIAGEKTCAGITPTPTGAPGNPNSPKNTTTHPPLAGPAGTPDNTTLIAPKNGTTLGSSSNVPNGAPATTNNGTNLNGALPTTTSPNSNLTNGNAANATNRFSGAVGSAAANASAQAGAASGFSSSSAIMFTAFSSCLLSLVI